LENFPNVSIAIGFFRNPKFSGQPLISSPMSILVFLKYSLNVSCS